MADLKVLCAELGFSRIETYIASGNVVFDCDRPAARVQAQLEKRLLAYAGKTVGVFVRTASEMRTVLKRNPQLTESGLNRLHVRRGLGLEYQPAGQLLPLRSIASKRGSTARLTSSPLLNACTGRGISQVAITPGS